jgi:hypothetical protein
MVKSPPSAAGRPGQGRCRHRRSFANGGAGGAAFELNERAGAQERAALDVAASKGYGQGDYTAAMSDDSILRRLLALNRERAASA